MDGFCPDMFGGTKAVGDDLGDAFEGVDDAPNGAIGLLVELARQALPFGPSRDSYATWATAT